MKTHFVPEKPGCSRRKKREKFGKTDAYVAEIIARFGYETYKARNADEIDDAKMIRLIEAERARERGVWLPIEKFAPSSGSRRSAYL